jgi:hypothetical protein
MKLVDDWKHAWKWASIHLAFLGMVLSAIGSALAMSSSAAQWYGAIPLWAVLIVASAIFACVIVARIIQFKHPK